MLNNKGLSVGKVFFTFFIDVIKFIKYYKMNIVIAKKI